MSNRSSGQEQKVAHVVASLRRPCPLRTYRHGSVRLRIRSPPCLSEPRRPHVKERIVKGKGSDTKSGRAAMHTGLDLGHSDGRVHHLAQERAGECAHGSLGSAVHATARVRFPSRDRSDVDDVACVAGLEVFRDVSFSAHAAEDHERKSGGGIS